jgi:hypothetical protein
MSLHDEINKAITSHALWRNRLARTIETGQSEIPPDMVHAVDQCEFGKWLYGETIAEEEKMRQHYETVCKLHEDFHKFAGDILKLALAGKKSEATKLMTSNGRFNELSAELVVAMMNWADAVKYHR